MSLLTKFSETQDERERRERRVRRFAFRAYRAVLHHLGEEAAKTLFEDFITEPRRRGGKDGSLNPARDQKFLAAHDELAKEVSSEADRDALLRKVAELLEEPMTTVESRIKHLRRLLRRRDRKLALQQARARRWSGGLTEDDSLLSKAVATKRDT